jgi:hypothetical protein
MDGLVSLQVDHQLQPLLTISQPIPNAHSTKVLPSNQPITVIMVTQLPMHGVTDPSSLIPTKVVANGGRLKLAKAIGLIELELRTEETAAQKDSTQLRCMLMDNFVAKSQVAQEEEHGLKSNAQSQCLVKR